MTHAASNIVKSVGGAVGIGGGGGGKPAPAAAPAAVAASTNKAAAAIANQDKMTGAAAAEGVTRIDNDQDLLGAPKGVVAKKGASRALLG